MSQAKLKPLASLYWTLAATILLAGLLVVAIFWLGNRARTEEDLARHTLAVHDQVTQLITKLQAAESSQRGYLLTGRDAYLAPFAGAVGAVPAALDKLATLVANDPTQQAAIARLRKLSADKIQEMRDTIAEHKAGQVDAVQTIVNSDIGLRAMDEVRQLTDAMQSEENQVFATRQASSAIFGLLLQMGIGTAFLLLCVVGVLASVLTRRAFVAVSTGRDKLAAANEELVQQISQREVVEGQLRQSQKMEAIGQLTGGIAHDFNNALGAIIGNLELIDRRLKQGNFDLYRHINASLNAARRAATLTNRLLAFARMQPLSPDALDGNGLIDGMSDILRSTLGEHIRVETIMWPGLWITKADAHQLENAILNIAINARDAMPAGGRLTIETSNTHLDEAYCNERPDVEPGQVVLISITDTGKGMSPEAVSRAFDPFFTTKPPGTGTGLGLSQVYGFVKQSHGHIGIYSELGRGTTVKIYLPRIARDSKTEVPPPRRRLQRGDSSEVVLVVEDDTLMRQIAADALSDLGYSIVIGENSKDAINILKRRSDIKLLFTDLVMPEIDGKRLADEALRSHPGLKVLFTTGYAAGAVANGDVLQVGAKVLNKPFTIDQLAEKVREVLGS